MSDEITLKTWALALALIATLALALAICGGAWGPSDLEMRVRASEPFKY